MSSLNRYQREWLRERIESRSALLREEIRAALHKNEEQSVALANHHDEIDDEAVADAETTVDVAELERDVHELRQLQDALTRIGTDDYGVCESCGADIPFPRLKADPQATRCVACQSDEERRQKRHRVRSE